MNLELDQWVVLCDGHGDTSAVGPFRTEQAARDWEMSARYPECEHRVAYMAHPDDAIKGELA